MKRKNLLLVALIAFSAMLSNALFAQRKPLADKDFPKEITDQIPTVTGKDGEIIFLKDSYVMLDCSLHKIIDGFDDYSLITGKIERAMVHKNYKIISYPS